MPGILLGTLVADLLCLSGALSFKGKSSQVSFTAVVEFLWVNNIDCKIYTAAVPFPSVGQSKP